MLPLVLIHVNNSHNIHKSDQLFSNRMILMEENNFKKMHYLMNILKGKLLRWELIIYVLVSDK